MNPDKWEKLRSICKAATNQQFAALPGLDYAINNGDRWVIFGDFDWPVAGTLSQDGQRIVQPEFWFKTNCAPNGPQRPQSSALRPWDQSMYCVWPIETIIDGKKIDDALPGYLQNHGIQDDPIPTVFDFMRSVKELPAAMSRMNMYCMVGSATELDSFLKKRNYLGSSLMFASDGPGGDRLEGG